MNNNNYKVFLDQEREDIQKATIEANESINEEEVKNVNNKIKVKKKNIFFRIIVVVMCLIIASLLTYYGVHFIKNEMEKDNNTTQTTTKVLNHVKTYIDNVNKVRRFKNDEQIIFLLPMAYNNRAIVMNISDKELINSYYGTYNILSDSVEINIDNSNNKYELTKNGIKDTNELLMDDSEYKYYIYNNEELILIDAYTNNSYLIESGKDIISYKYEEKENEIVIGDKSYNKVNDNLVINNKTYILSY